MKRKLVLFLVASLLVIMMFGCSGKGKGSVAEEAFSFADLAKYQYGFSSGAGGWGEEFTIEKDGYFEGQYQDFDMGGTGEGYENGTVYMSSYSGHFTNLKKVDEFTYTMELADISYKQEPGTESIQFGTLYFYTNAYCLGGNNVFTIYLPGYSFDKLSDEVKMWVKDYNSDQTELTSVVIVDEKNSYGIYSYERMAPLEEARSSYEACEESYNYYANLASEAYTTLDMLECANAMYEVSDACLNHIWKLIRYNVSEKAFEPIQKEQQEWIEETELKADENAAEWGGGSFAPVAYIDMKATLTFERCKELLTYLE